MVEQPEPAAHRSQDGADSGKSQLPPPPVALPPPPPAGQPIAGRPRKGGEVKSAIVALSLAAVGWLVWLFAWVAEGDTGYPEGLACTAHAEASEAYASCMRSSERGGAIAWSLTLGLAVTGIVMVVRSRRGRLFEARVHPLAIIAGAISALLAIAGVNIWIRGANGTFYEDRLGATAWHLPMVIAVAAGLVVGWAASRRRQDRV